MSYSTVTTGNRFGLLQEVLQEDASLPQDPVISPEPGSTPPPPEHRRRHQHRPRRQSGYLAPPLTPTPDLDPGFTHSIFEAEVHQPQDSPSRQGQEPGRTYLPPCRPLPPVPLYVPKASHPPQDPVRPAAGLPSSVSSRETVITSLFTLLWKGYHLYQEGTPVPDILTYLWPILSMLISLFQ
ncbi:hypothetical protein GWK47_018335 [Chionoecetes opilio]|uniref:Uncharacterized protein n=1 Tax=Chionoecetes opilio TaxID=41210 RepID=A0A8J5BXZ3_CHIOP|nr:hypothetical protein GWK47_018335 [Chionoecetes opilio]